ncbi:bifunctional DNA primase/polymerase [Streptomyces sp. DSM 3412]|uniref:Bifunctional DNA primase/polymerase n=1 Tax=Streptomyces gottesmaniae TaxID=3075518 RepID=A0ABU2Z589_9ACTN|nr:bifunctional DNA primase/polymerase [Streptomyces sp. DSM 3412]MDT0571444.1 bifunctional DNA primase/polymerase [Streptomyces sp. DSM 3412]
MSGGVGTGRYPEDGVDVAGVTAEGAAWLASAGTYPRSTLTLWEERPTAPVVLPCGTVFDVVSVPALFGRRMLDRLWAEGPGSGPVAVYRGRVLLFASPGTAHRLPTLLEWEEWGSPGRTGAVPPLLCHGTGDAVTVPAVLAPEDSGGTDGSATSDTPGVTRLGSRWLVAPDTRRPWLPGPDVLLWAAVRAARSSASATVRVSIFPPADQGAKVYDVSRRR